MSCRTWPAFKSKYNYYFCFCKSHPLLGRQEPNKIVYPFVAFVHFLNLSVEQLKRLSHRKIPVSSLSLPHQLLGSCETPYFLPRHHHTPSSTTLALA